MKKLKRRYLDEGDELGVDWERWADGRVWHLKRKRDFPDVHPNLAREAVLNAAERMGKAVQSIRDRRTPTSPYVWVQFADHEIGLGDPCPCGSRRLFRLHTYFARCAECNAQLILSKASVMAADDAIEPAPDDSGLDEDEDDSLLGSAALRRLKDIRLSRLKRSGERDVYRGYALDGTTLVLLIVEFHLGPGESLEPEDVLDRAASVRAIPFDQVDGLVDTSVLLSRRESEWDLVL